MFGLPKSDQHATQNIRSKYFGGGCLQLVTKMTSRVWWFYHLMADSPSFRIVGARSFLGTPIFIALPFFVSFTNVSFLMPGQFWWWRLFTFWERNVPGPLPQRSNRKLESKKFFSMDPGTACHYHGAAGKVDSSGGSFAGFQKMLIFRCFLLGLCAGFPPLSFNFELP